MMRRVSLPMCGLVSVLGLSAPFASGQPSRMFFVPAGTDPNEATPYAGSPFPVTLEAGQTIRVEAYLANQVTTISGFTVAWSCSSESSSVTPPSVTFVADSARVDCTRADYVFAGVCGFASPDEGQCDPNLACTSSFDCPGYSTCVDDLCTILVPRTGGVNLAGGVVFPDGIRYMGDVTYEIPPGAHGTYRIGPVCCGYGELMADGDCDGVLDPDQSDPVCPLNLTVVSDASIQLLPFTVDPLDISVWSRSCCTGDGGCTAGLTVSECVAGGGMPLPDGQFCGDDDCDGNGTFDACEIASGAARDCQPNGVPDQCDLDSRTSLDNNGNGIPDECDVECDQDCDCYFAAIAAAEAAGVFPAERLNVCTYHYCDMDGLCASCRRDKSGQTVAPWNPGGIVGTDDILCVGYGFGDYCLCPNGDVVNTDAPLGKGPRGIPIGTDDILAVVAMFGDPDPFGCPGVPASDLRSCDTGAPPPIVLSTGDRGWRMAGRGFRGSEFGVTIGADPPASPSAIPDPAPAIETPALTLVPRAKVVPPGGTIAVDAFIRGVEGMVGFEFAVRVVGDDSEVELRSVTIDTNRSDYAFFGLQAFPATDAEMGRIGGVVIGPGVDVPYGEPAYAGTFEFDVSPAAAGIVRFSADPERCGIWYGVNDKVSLQAITDARVRVTPGQPIRR